MELNADTIELFAAKNYTNPFCHSKEEFIEDLNRIIDIKNSANKKVLPSLSLLFLIAKKILSPVINSKTAAANIKQITFHLNAYCH